jgi:subtilisin family serine protease
MKKLLTILLVLACFSVRSQDIFNVSQHAILDVKDKSSFLEFARVNEIQILNHYDQLGWFLVKLDSDESYDEFEKKMATMPFVNKIYPDEIQNYDRDYLPSDPSFSSQWYLAQLSDKDIDADLAWDSIPANNTPVKVAVFDGGIDVSHEDLVGNIVTPFNAVTNSFSNGEFVNSFDRHGTSCSGTIAAVTNNGTGVASVGGNKVKVMPINIMSSLTSSGSFSTSTAIQVNAINAAIAQGCVAISMSYGGGSYSSALDAAFQSAKTIARNGKGLFICASTGNDYSGTAVKYPASYVAVYGIGATTSNDLRANFSNYGSIVDISAPGASILTTDVSGANGYNAGNYASVSGTSFSCPITAAAGALLIYKNQDLTEFAVMQILAASAEKVGNYAYSTNPLWPYSTRSNELGYGRINLFEAVKLTPTVGNPVIDPPTPVHNFFLSNCAVSNISPTVGTTVTISTQQKTNTPSLAAVSPILQYRWSTDNVWSSNDVVIGEDQSSLGGGLDSEIESITFTVPTVTGTGYVLIKANYNDAVEEVTNVDNTCSVQLTLINPGSSGTDLRVFFLNSQITTCGTSTGSSGATIRFQNTGSVPIGSFTYRYRWDGCPIAGTPSYFNCNNVATGQGWLTNPIAPGAMSGTYQHNLCIANCGLANAPYTIIPVGTTRNLIVEILTVNGVAGDDFAGNNTAVIPVTRISCSTSNNSIDGEMTEEQPEEQPTVKIYTVTGQLLEATDIRYLSAGIYVVHYIYSDHIIRDKIFVGR